MDEMISRRKVIDILEKMQFFQGSRAGRELWFDKPVEVQEQDCEDFTRDIRTIRDYILQLEEQINNKWTPCSKALPPKPKANPAFNGKLLELYFVCTKSEYPFRAFWNGMFFTDGFSKVEPIAWMSLPETYNEGAD